MNHELQLEINRRYFFGRSSSAVGLAALGSLLTRDGFSLEPSTASLATHNGPGYGPGTVGPTHFPAQAKRVIYLVQSGAPSQMDTFDYKPSLDKLDGQELPDSIRSGQRVTGMTAGQKSFPAAKAIAPFRQYGQSGTWISDLLPNHGKIVDDICIIKSLHTEAINHDPGITFFQTGHQQPGRPSLGAWVSYGLGSESQDFPSFVVLLDINTEPQAQPIYSRLWGSGFLPSNHQGVKFRSKGDPVLYLQDPTGGSLADKRRLLDRLSKLNQLRHEQVGDPEITTRIAAYEMSYRMQMSTPELIDLADEPQHTFDLYGEEAKQPGTHASNCLLARRLIERGVRFVQVYHRGWDHHSSLPEKHPKIAREVDQGSAALIQDLKQRGLLNDTLVVWGGEFGRTVYKQGNPVTFGRDHHPRCFSMWLAGGGIRPGISYGTTDDWCYNVTENPVHVHDLNATILNQLGFDHERLTYRFQGRDYRLTDIHGQVVRDVLT